MMFFQFLTSTFIPSNLFEVKFREGIPLNNFVSLILNENVGILIRKSHYKSTMLYFKFVFTSGVNFSYRDNS